MFELSDFYHYCRENQVEIIPFLGSPSPGATIRDQDFYAVFLDFSQIPTTRFLRGVCYHELGHVATGALHKVDSPYELVERSEYRAMRWGASQFLTPERFRAAFHDGCRELWQLAEYFDMPEEVIADAYAYWKDCRGVDFTE